MPAAAPVEIAQTATPAATPTKKRRAEASTSKQGTPASRRSTRIAERAKKNSKEAPVSQQAPNQVLLPSTAAAPAISREPTPEPRSVLAPTSAATAPMLVPPTPAPSPLKPPRSKASSSLCAVRTPRRLRPAPYPAPEPTTAANTLVERKGLLSALFAAAERARAQDDCACIPAHAHNSVHPEQHTPARASGYVPSERWQLFPGRDYSPPRPHRVSLRTAFDLQCVRRLDAGI